MSIFHTLNLQLKLRKITWIVNYITIWLYDWFKRSRVNYVVDCTNFDQFKHILCCGSDHGNNFVSKVILIYCLNSTKLNQRKYFPFFQQLISPYSQSQCKLQDYIWKTNQTNAIKAGHTHTHMRGIAWKNYEKGPRQSSWMASSKHVMLFSIPFFFSLPLSYTYQIKVKKKRKRNC